MKKIGTVFQNKIFFPAMLNEKKKKLIKWILYGFRILHGFEILCGFKIFYGFLAVFVKNIFPFSPLLISKQITFLT